MPDFRHAMRRVVTGDNNKGQSVIIIDGGPASSIGNPEIDGLFEIWEDAASGLLESTRHEDLGGKHPVLGPRKDNFQVRWFVISPPPEDMPKAELDAATRDRFVELGAVHHMTDQARHSAMHKTDSIDVICLLQGEVSLILDGSETRLRPGNVVIQRGTSHAWQAHGGPALLMGVLIDREIR